MFGGGLEAGQHGTPDSLAALIGFDVHPLRLGGRRVEDADGPTPDRPVTVARDEKGAMAPFEMFSFEVWPEALLGRIKLGQVGVKRRDQSAGVVGVERFGRHAQAGGGPPPQDRVGAKYRRV